MDIYTYTWDSHGCCGFNGYIQCTYEKQPGSIFTKFYVGGLQKHSEVLIMMLAYVRRARRVHTTPPGENECREKELTRLESEITVRLKHAIEAEIENPQH